MDKRITQYIQGAEMLTGGNSNQVRREGRSVVRQMGAWSGFVHALLRHLTAKGFAESPVLLEHDDSTERLTFLDGEVGHYPLKEYMQSDDILVEAAKLLRRLHDATLDFVMPPDAQFFLPVDVSAGYEVICHNDFAPYNWVFREGHLAGVIDFDTAAPGSQVWDVAYAVYRLAPLATDAHCTDQGWQQIPDRAKRLRLFCEAYGLDERAGLVETVIKRLEALVQYMRDTGANPEHIPLYVADLAYIRDNQAQFEAVLR